MKEDFLTNFLVYEVALDLWSNTFAMELPFPYIRNPLHPFSAGLFCFYRRHRWDLKEVLNRLRMYGKWLFHGNSGNSPLLRQKLKLVSA